MNGQSAYGAMVALIFTVSGFAIGAFISLLPLPRPARPLRAECLLPWFRADGSRPSEPPVV
jgi:hypothetical protein